MSNSSQLESLADLSDVLEQLSKQTLPVQTRGILQNARQRLAQLSQSLSENTEENRLAALYRVSQSLGLTLNLDEVLNQVMDAIIELTGAERGFLTLLEHATGEQKLRAARNLERETLQSEDMEVSRTVIQSVMDTDKGVVTTDAQTDPRFAGQESVVFHSLKSIMCAPLRANGQIIGVIYVENRAQSGIFTNSDLELLNAFTNQAAVAIQNARLYTRTDQALAERVSELEILSLIDRELNAKLDLTLALEISRRWAIKGTAAQECWIALVDEESNLMQIYAGPTDGKIPEPGSNVFSAIARKTTPQGVSAGSVSYLAAPLLHGDETQGAIIVAGDSAFQTSEQEFLTRLTGRAAAAIANARLYQEVQQANESKSQFVAIVTHELRIPLTSIKGYTDLLRQGVVGEINEQQLNFLSVIRNNVERMSTLISDLSDISRIERGKLNLELGSVELGGYVEETISSLRHKIEEKNQTLIAEIPKELPLLHADPNRLVQVLTNLVSNAWKYTPEGGEIILRASQIDEGIRVEVIDNGLGISPEDQAKLFTQFFRSESPLVREQIGWGLGLNVTKKLVEFMNGEIGFSSELNQGSTFWFILPVFKEA
jgi:signal transduction histidine kinase